MVLRTSVLHWEDCLYRRRGMWYLWLKKHDPERYEMEFNEAADALGWDKSKRIHEKNQP
jgi:hypothetical protein